MAQSLQLWKGMDITMKFTKMHGCGNDYIYVDGSKEIIPAEKKPEIVKRLSDRHFGIGGDSRFFKFQTIGIGKQNDIY